MRRRVCVSNPFFVVRLRWGYNIIVRVVFYSARYYYIRHEFSVVYLRDKHQLNALPNRIRGAVMSAFGLGTKKKRPRNV